MGKAFIFHFEPGKIFINFSSLNLQTMKWSRTIYISKLAVIFCSFCLLFFAQCKSEGSSAEEETQKLSGHQGIDQLSEAIKQNPQEADLYFQRGKLYYESEIYSDAIKDLILSTEYDSLYAEAWHLLADAFLDNNQSRQAIETLESFLTIQPDKIETLLKIAEFQLIVERYKAAHLHIDKILRSQADHAEALFMKGLIYRAEGLNIPAAEYFQKAVQSDPDLVDGYLLLGELFEQARNPLALRYYQNALRIQPDHKEAKLAIANFYWTQDNYPAALETLDALISQDPFFTKALFNKGLIYLELDSLDKAYESLTMASKSDPTFARAHYYLGHTKERSGETDAALNHFKNALNFSPRDKLILESISRLEK
jgi:tetratricopeptide (TPR) repeat protein